MPINTNDKNTSLYMKETYWFITFSFIMTFTLIMSAYFQTGHYTNGSEIWRLSLTFSMLTPAASAILCLLLFRRQSLNQAASLFLGVFLATALLPIVLKTLIKGPLYEYAQMLLVLASTALIILLNLKKSWRDKLRPFGLAFERGFGFTALFLFLYILMLIVSFALNPLFELSQFNDGMTLATFLSRIFISIITVAAGGWIVYFGEEYGWRYYLQHRLINLLGRTRGVLLLGMVWGLWHAPAIALGYNYPDRPLLGMMTMTLFAIVIGIFYSIAVMKTGSVWPAVILHGVNNSIAPILLAFFGDVPDRVFAFGIGLFGIAAMAIPALWLLGKADRKQIHQPVEFELN